MSDNLLVKQLEAWCELGEQIRERCTDDHRPAELHDLAQLWSAVVGVADCAHNIADAYTRHLASHYAAPPEQDGKR